jgi:hypothetical protein
MKSAFAPRRGDVNTGADLEFSFGVHPSSEDGYAYARDLGIDFNRDGIYFIWDWVDADRDGNSIFEMWLWGRPSLLPSPDCLSCLSWRACLSWFMISLIMYMLIDIYFSLNMLLHIYLPDYSLYSTIKYATS